MSNFDERYKLYLDWTAQTEWDWDNDTDASWVEVFLDSRPSNKSLAEGEKFLRHKWGEVTLNNDPKQYAIASSNAFRIYDIVEGLEPDQEIRIKRVTDNNTIRGYFGNNDCKFNDNDNGKIATVTPATLDQYTAVLENAKKKIDVIGNTDNTSARFEYGGTLTPRTGNHNVPLKLISSDIDEIAVPVEDALPNAGGAFLAVTKTTYGAELTAVISASLAVASGHTIQFFFREYDSANNLLQESSLPIYGAGIVNINTTFSYSPTLAQGSYVTFECEFSDPGGADFVSYSSLDFSVLLDAEPLATISVEVSLLSSNLIAKNVWTEPLHGRASPKDSEWGSVSDYFEVSGAPKSALFSDPELGPVSQPGAKFSNGLDVNNEPIEYTNLTELETLLSDFEYELSSVTVWEGSTYRTWKPFGTKKRRVFGTCTFSREEYWKIDEGAPDPPPGTGWEQTTVMNGGKRLWIRKPLNGTVTDWDLQSKDSSGGNNGSFEWGEKQQTIKSYPSSDNSRTFDSVRELKEVIKTIYNNMDETLDTKDIYSTFFWNDNEGDLNFYDSQPSGTNYVSLEGPNPLNRLGCIHTADFDTDDTELDKDNQTLEISFTDIMDDLRKLWPIYWFVDLNGDLHIEHIKYLDLTITTVDVRGNPLLDETLRWSYNKELMFSDIEYETINSGYRDFTGSATEFNKIASNKRNLDLTLELTTEILSTDIKYCIENPGDLQNGLTVVAYDTDFKMINAYVPILRRVFENGAIALSNLLIKYWTYEGVWTMGKINSVDYEFTETARTKTGKEIDLQNIIDIDGSGDEVRFITTEIGIGMIKNMTQDFDRGITTGITLIYRYDSNPEANTFQLVTTHDNGTGDPTLYDFGNYVN